MNRQFLRWIVLAGVFAVVHCSAVGAQEHYYMMICAAEGPSQPARSAHTFATFIRAKERANVEAHTISWLPANLNVRLLAAPEQGRNLGLKDALELEKARGNTVFAWGPFEIRKDLYERALSQIRRLESGQVAYRALDGRFRPGTATNCFHAVSDIVDTPLLDTGTAFGVPASAMVLQHLAPWVIDPTKAHRELDSYLGLDDYAISFRDEGPAVKR
jgi:hypothetical protein